eukprot:5606162-Ditylum_brightwellii.AAC.1
MRETKIIFLMKTGGAKHHFKTMDEKSHPADRMNALLTLTPEGNLEELSKFDVTGWYKDLNTQDIMQIFGTCILDGLDHSPQII